MGDLRLERLIDFLAGVDPVTGVLWIGLVVLTGSLLLLTRTRWGQAHPVRKCVVLSLLAHALFAGYTTTVQIVNDTPTPRIREAVIEVSIDNRIDDRPIAMPDELLEANPWESLARDALNEPTPEPAPRPEPLAMDDPTRQSRLDQTGIDMAPELDDLVLADAVQPLPDERLNAQVDSGNLASSMSAEPLAAPKAERREAAEATIPDASPNHRRNPPDARPSPTTRSRSDGLPSMLLERPLSSPKLADLPKTDQPETSLETKVDVISRSTGAAPIDDTYARTAPEGPQLDAAVTVESGPIAGRTEHLLPPSISQDGRAQNAVAAVTPTIDRPMIRLNRQKRDDYQTPSIYKARTAPDRSRLAQMNGATSDSETAVKAALRWLADNQAPDGRWNAESHGAGQEQLVAGRDRGGAGIQADTGITALATLAFLASGHTHQEGDFRDEVRGAVEFLVQSQADDGNLAGGASVYAFMYCHAMAAFALSEAYAMTGDQQLAEPVRRAITYTVRAQDPDGGGWRYRPGDPGDTSQFGWQVMALKSAELAGIPLPERTRSGMHQFLESVSSGTYGGLAAYRPSEQPSRPMTAEALCCRMFLGMSDANPAGREAGDYLMLELPGDRTPNLYYWYYGTLGTFQLQSIYWQRWNASLQAVLVASQEKSGTKAGSWSPDTQWGGYGGRVYSTALATLCLEVYYRFLPMNIAAASHDRRFR